MEQQHPSIGGIVRAAAWRTSAAAVFWWLLTEGTGGWYLGVPAIATAVLASLVLAPPSNLRISPPGLLLFCAVFVLRSVGAGLQVARYAFAPRPALRPGRLALATTLPAGLPRVLLANTLTLQPGTLSVSLEQDLLRVHVLDETQPLEEDVRALETRIARMLRIPQ